MCAEGNWPIWHSTTKNPTTTTLKYTFQYLANVSDSPDRLLNFELLSDRIEQVNSTLEVKGILYYHNQGFYDLIFSQQRSYRGRLSLLRASPFGLYFATHLSILNCVRKVESMASTKVAVLQMVRGRETQ